MKQLLSFILITITLFTFGQVTNFKTKFTLPQEVKETSGLLLVNGKIVTHNDSGDTANLYEIDSLSGNLIRTITISNATNVDWEDITEDSTHIYIGDIGNNAGSRTDLKIYKILKADYLTNTSVKAEIINYSYEDQTDFTSRPNANNFDAEAIVIYQNSLIIFTKNWINSQTNVYKIPLSAGTYSAEKVSTANVEVLITGATYNLENDTFFLSAYDKSANPFLIYIDKNRKPGENIFFSGFTKISLIDKIEQGSQIEGITAFGNGKYYLSREFVSVNQRGMTFTFPQRLYEFYDEKHNLLSIHQNNSSNVVSIQPNPVVDNLIINMANQIVAITDVKVYSILGKQVAGLKFLKSSNEVDVSSLKKGVYLIKIRLEDQTFVSKKFIKL